jgi:hypothetical protein
MLTAFEVNGLCLNIWFNVVLKQDNVCKYKKDVNYFSKNNIRQQIYRKHFKGKIFVHHEM